MKMVENAELPAIGGTVSVLGWGDTVGVHLGDKGGEVINVIDLLSDQATEVALELLRRSNGLDDAQVEALRASLPLYEVMKAREEDDAQLLFSFD